MVQGLLGFEAPTFSLRAGPYRSGQLEVVEFRGREEISKLFRFDIWVAARHIEELSFSAVVLQQNACLALSLRSGTTRSIYGMVSAIEPAGYYVADHAARIRLRLVPHLWALTRRKNSRIFQDKRIHEIIDVILDEGHIERRWELSRRYPLREYCVQYQETDYEFIVRLLAEEGIFFNFSHPGLEGEAENLAGAAMGSLAGAAGSAVGGAAGGLLGGALAGAAGAAMGAFGPSETVVFSDTADHYPPMKLGTFDVSAGDVAGAVGLGAVTSAAASVGINLDPGATLLYRDVEGMAAPEDAVFKFTLTRELKPKSTYLHDWDFRKPTLSRTALAQTEANARAGLPKPGDFGVSAALTLGPAGISAGVGASIPLEIPPRVEPRRYEIYDHESDDHREHDIAKIDAEVQLEQRRRKAFLARGSSFCRTMQAGYRFVLDEHSDLRFNREYVVTRVDHHGQIPEGFSSYGTTTAGEADIVYQNTFQAIPSRVPFRPKRPIREMRQVMETAIVVGPADEEIYTDSYGRIKVKFHWDRDGKANETASCWIRVAQSWSGTGWGFQFVPRVGMEVLVSFLGGSPDRPIVTGCVYNGTHPHPYSLPGSKTRSGIRTQTTPGGEGYNEIYFEDQRGIETIHLHAQKDLEEIVLNDHTTTVSHDQVTNVTGNKTLGLSGSYSAEVAKNYTLNVAASASESVGGQKTETINGSLTSHIDGGVLSFVGGDRRAIVSGMEATMVEGRSVHVVKESMEFQVGKAFQTVVGTEEEEAFSSTYVFGDLLTRVSKTMFFNAQESITLRVGDSQIILEPKQITIASEAIVVTGSKSVTASADGPRMELTDEALIASDTIKLYAKDTAAEFTKDGAQIVVKKKVELIGQSSSLVLDANAALDGTKLKLQGGAASGTPGTASSEKKDKEEKEPETKPLKITLKDEELEPYKSRPYVLKVGEKAINGTTTDEGLVEQDVPKEATTALLTLWVTDPPTGRKLEWTIDLTVEEVPPATMLTGALTRLAHLGYYKGPLTLTAPTGEVEAAVRWFQRDHELPATGEIDGATAGKIEEVHGS